MNEPRNRLRGSFFTINAAIYSVHEYSIDGPVTLRCFSLVHVFCKHDLFCKIRTF